ncbi:hypothetical protein VCRA2120E57_450021 [Vibrio crassostreae]|nr:hypothetical protein VCRA2120E57_450021 [Vibrio crassostreae]
MGLFPFKFIIRAGIIITVIGNVPISLNLEWLSLHGLDE